MLGKNNIFGRACRAYKCISVFLWSLFFGPFVGFEFLRVVRTLQVGVGEWVAFFASRERMSFLIQQQMFTASRGFGTDHVLLKTSRHV